MESTRDGFKLAEMDLELRGPGAIYGSKQHGALDLKIANISDVALIKNAKKSAAIFIKRSDNLADYQELEKRVQKSLSLTYLN